MRAGSHASLRSPLSPPLLTWVSSASPSTPASCVPKTTMASTTGGSASATPPQWATTRGATLCCERKRVFRSVPSRSVLRGARATSLRGRDTTRARRYLLARQVGLATSPPRAPCHPPCPPRRCVLPSARSERPRRREQRPRRRERSTRALALWARAPSARAPKAIAVSILLVGRCPARQTQGRLAPRKASGQLRRAACRLEAWARKAKPAWSIALPESRARRARSVWPLSRPRMLALPSQSLKPARRR
mmetsp:Transcript_32775/g.90448  ORF Transcript_32775/g.90448 Transcript_32775/m.90448 type:complete len:249 (-) Transcript_32775:31-777(-)